MTIVPQIVLTSTFSETFVLSVGSMRMGENLIAFCFLMRILSEVHAESSTTIYKSNVV